MIDYSSITSVYFIGCIIGTEEYHLEKEGHEQNVTGSDRASQPDFGVTFRDIPAATLVLFRNPIYVLITISNIADISFLAGAEVFLAKFVELQFGLSAGDANISVGKNVCFECHYFRLYIKIID